MVNVSAEHVWEGNGLQDDVLDVCWKEKICFGYLSLLSVLLIDDIGRKVTPAVILAR